MKVELFKTPVPSTAFLRDPEFKVLGGRKCSLSYSYEAEKNGTVNFDVLVFEGVEGFKSTYYTACSLEMLEAYDRVLDLGNSDWLGEVGDNLRQARADPDGLKHMRIYFDDGPCFEFICRSLRVLTER